MKLVEGDGHAAAFSCPYHGWTYNLDGSLRNAPFMQDAAAFNPGSRVRDDPPPSGDGRGIVT
jgi:phenylpropionate dioxygenase-like ring-hydroxylating dioxygenase large terminal subunit